MKENHYSDLHTARLFIQGVGMCVSRLFLFEKGWDVGKRSAANKKPATAGMNEKWESPMRQGHYAGLDFLVLLCQDKRTNRKKY